MTQDKPSNADMVVPETLAKAPLEACVKMLFGMSWNEARRAIGNGKIRHGGVAITNTRFVPGTGATLSFHQNAPRPRTTVPLTVVYEDDAVIVVDKPSGLITVPFGDSGETSLADWVRAHLSKGQRGNVRPELGVVHRIDQETSGLVVFTRTWRAKQALAEQFRLHTVWRRYLGFAQGAPSAGTITSHIGRDRGDGLRGSVSSGGERAVTHVEVVERHQRITLIACRLETGRTHQIRIHLSEAGHPLLGEWVYVKNARGQPYVTAAVKAPRLMLHAAELGFVHPLSGKELRWSSQPPADFTAVVG